MANVRDQFFSNAYQNPDIFADRDGELGELGKIHEDIERRRGSVSYISEFLGSGKTFLVEQMLLRVFRVPEPLVLPTLTDLQGKKWSECHFLTEFLSKTGFLIIDDIDVRKSDFWANLATVKDVLKEKGSPILAIGDSSLRTPEIQQFLGQDKSRVQLHAFDKEFFHAVMKLRHEAYVRKAKTKTYQDLEYDPSIFADSVLEILFPKTEAPVSIVRVILNMLSQISAQLPYNSDICSISVEWVRKWLRNRRLFMNAEQMTFFSWFTGYMKTKVISGERIKFASSEELLERCEPLHSRFKEIRQFEDKVLFPLATMYDYLVPFGTPHGGENGLVKYPPPYLPSVLTLAYSLCGGK